MRRQQVAMDSMRAPARSGRTYLSDDVPTTRWRLTAVPPCRRHVADDGEFVLQPQQPLRELAP